MSDISSQLLAFCAQNKQALIKCTNEINHLQFEDLSERLVFFWMANHWKKHESLLSSTVLDKYLDKDKVNKFDEYEQQEAVDLLDELKESFIDLNDFEYFLSEFKIDYTKRMWRTLLAGSIEDDGGINPGLIDIAERDPWQAYEIFQREIGKHMETALRDGRAETNAVHEIYDGWFEEYEEIELNPEQAYGIRTGYSYIDEATLGIKPGELFLFGGRHGCLTGKTEIYDPETGLFVELSDLVERQQGNVLSFNEQSQRLLVHTPSDYIYQGKRQTFMITTSGGRKINATSNHPFLTWQGWKALDQLEIGDKVATARVLSEPLVPISMEKDVIKTLAYIISEGGTTQNTLSFTNGDKEIQADCEKSLRYFDAELKNDGSKCCHRINSSSRLKSFLKEQKLLGKYSYEKFIPDIIFRLPNNEVALFLGILWSGDGGVGITRNYLSFGTASPKLTQDVQRLLSRFGIVSHYREKPNKGRGSYEIEIYSQREVIKFIKYIAPYMVGEKRDRIFAYQFDKLENPNVDVFFPQTWRLVKEEKDKQKLSWKKILGHKFNGLPITMAHRSVSRVRLERINKKLNSSILQTYIDSEIYWDTIVSIEKKGVEDVYDLTVPTTNGQEPNFVANQFIVHNSGKSVALLNVAVNAYKDGENVLIVSIEMPKKQYFERFLACYADLPIKEIQTARLTKEQKKTVKKLGTEIKNKWNHGQQYLLIADIPNVTANTVRAEVNQAISKCGFKPDLVVVDYLGIMKSIDKEQADWQEQTKAAEELRELGRTENLAMVSAVQLNRDGKKSTGTQRIARADGIGATCDVFIQIIEPNEKEEEENAAIIDLDDTLEIELVKNRKGEGGLSFQLYKNFANMIIRNKDVYRPHIERELESLEEINTELTKLSSEIKESQTINTDGEAPEDQDLRENGDFIAS